MPKSFLLDSALHDYLVSRGSPPDRLRRDLIAQTEALGPVSAMQIAPEQGAFMTMLTRLVQPRFAVEIGTFTGYSALCIAEGLPEGATLVCCDVDETWTAVARRYWEAAGVSERIDLRLGPASRTLAALEDRPVELAFIDADKESYLDYYEQLVPRMAPGALLLVDNVLWGGRVLDEDPDETTSAIRAFNDHVAADPRTEVVMLPVSDGLSIIRKH